MRWFWSRILLLLLGAAAPALADEDSPATVTRPDAPGETELSGAAALPRSFDPPRVDYPPLQGLGIGISLYVDHTYETTDDLSTFWWVSGRGSNYRLSVGGMYQYGALRLSAEIPVQYTLLHIDSFNIDPVQPQPPIDADRNKAELSLGDIGTSATYFWDFAFEDLKASVGLGLRVRWPTHTTKFSFSLVNNTILEFGFPYYLHVTPNLVLHASYGPVSITVNQGILSMLAKDVDLGGVIQRIPNFYFWESHLAADVAATDWLYLSAELVGCVQLNSVDVYRMTNLNGTKAFFINPGVTFDLGGIRLSLAARFGLPGRSSRDFGVITFSGSNAYMARVSYMF